MKYIIDKIEEGVIVLEDSNGNIINYKKKQGETIINVFEGDVISFDINGKIIKDNREKEKIKKRISEKMKNMWE